MHAGLCAARNALEVIVKRWMLAGGVAALAALVVAAATAPAASAHPGARLRWECAAVSPGGEVLWQHGAVSHSTRAGAEVYARAQGEKMGEVGEAACASRLPLLLYARATPLPGSTPAVAGGHTHAGIAGPHGPPGEDRGFTGALRRFLAEWGIRGAMIQASAILAREGPSGGYDLQITIWGAPGGGALYWLQNVKG